ncbi:apurinic-apyrimidinic endonuclease-like [Mytilus californianus]|uniref:apurinic-apyrimidinic endonuclease-like n=1 Tax=Mytilus californianus TaxID=6549 RepID=UPI00224526F7|nr:apurinic-apyrimidinic endonuclease-like [Mytilus californianus]
MKTKSKNEEKVETSDGEIVIKKPKLLSLGRRKKHGDKLGTVELSNEDGFMTDEEDGDKEGQYEGCKHFEVESKHIKEVQTKKLHVQDRVKTPVSIRKRKMLKKRTIKIKVEVKVKNKPGTVKVRLEDTAKLAKKKKMLKKKKEMKKLLETKGSSKENTKLQSFKLEERTKQDPSNVVIKTENISEDEKQLKSHETKIVNVRKRGRPSKVEKVEENENLSSLGTETKLKKERKRKEEKTNQEEDPNIDTRKKKKTTNDDKIDLHLSISEGKTENIDVDVDEKESKKTLDGKKKKADNTDNREKDTSANLKEKKKKKKTEEFSEVVVDERKVDLNQEKFVGAHVSIAGGIYKSVLEAVAMKSFAFGLFLKSQRQWACKPLEDKAAEKFRETCQVYGFLPQYIVPHGSYLMNLGSPDENTLQKSRELLIDDLQRCEKLGLTIFNFHPGSTCGKISVEKCLDNIAASINFAHSKASGVITVLENMSCQGHTIGGKFEELRGIIDRVKDKSRMGVCLDTCHAFAAGFDLSTEEGFNQMLSDFESIVGFQYLKALHINDSKGKLGCHLDRHENIGKGHIGKAGFNRIMNCPKFNHIPMILETPCADNDSYAKEVNMLYTMCNT